MSFLWNLQPNLTEKQPQNFPWLLSFRKRPPSSHSRQIGSMPQPPPHVTFKHVKVPGTHHAIHIRMDLELLSKTSYFFLVPGNLFQLLDGGGVPDDLVNLYPNFLYLEQPKKTPRVPVLGRRTPAVAPGADEASFVTCETTTHPPSPVHSPQQQVQSFFQRAKHASPIVVVVSLDHRLSCSQCRRLSHTLA